MSYCRWSDEDYQCDVYCYASVSGYYVTHVASNRLVLDVQLPPAVPITAETLGKVSERRGAVMEWLESAESRPIGLPHDGETFQDADADEAADTLQKLKDAGYNVPQYAIDSLRAEAQADAEEGK